MIRTIRITPPQIRMARASLHWNQKRLAKESGVSGPIVNRVEHGYSHKDRTNTRLRDCFEKHGIEFFTDGDKHVVVCTPQEWET